MADITTRQAVAPRIPLRAIGVALVIIALLLAATFAYIGAHRPRVPAPFGPATNGLIAFSVQGDTWTLDPATGTRALLAHDAANDDGAAFSPDGTRIAILSIEPDGGNRIRITPLDGAAATYLAPDPFEQLHGWSWSPDGRSMATIHAVDGVRSLSIVPTDGGPIRTLDLGGLTAMGATWRPPDGRELLLTGERDAQIGLYLIGEDGSGLRPLVGPETAFGPVTGWSDPNITHLGGATWSPDGTHIAYVSVRPGADGEPIARVHVMRADGSGDRELMAREGVSDTWPQWSPDGDRLLVGRISDGETWSAVLDLDGGAVDLGRRLLMANGGLAVSIWSPDGRQVLLLDGNEMRRVDADTGTPVGDAWTDVSWPGWQRVAP